MFGIIASLDQPIVGIPTSIMGVFMALSRIGIQINPTTKEYRNYKSYVGIKRGTWSSYETFPILCVMRVEESTSAASLSNRKAETSREKYYDVCLFSKIVSETRHGCTL